MARPKKTSEPVKAVETKKTVRKPRTKAVKEQPADQSKPVEEKQQARKYVVSVSSWLNVRSGAGMEYPVIDKLNDGDAVIITEKNGEWGRIDDAGWVMLKFLK